MFATPLTRQVFEVRAIANVSYDEIDDEMASTMRALAMKFGREGGSIDNDAKAIIFDNKDGILVRKKGRKVIVYAFSHRLNELQKKEVVKADKERYAEDIELLALKPGKEEGDDRIYKIDSVFGMKFGEPLVKNIAVKKDILNLWVHEFTPSRKFMGCNSYKVLATEKTKKVCGVEIRYCGYQYDARYDEICRVIEMITGREMRKENENNATKEMEFGDCRIILIKDEKSKTVHLMFIKLSLMRQHNREHEEVERDTARSDLNAL